MLPPTPARKVASIVSKTVKIYYPKTGSKIVEHKSQDQTPKPKPAVVVKKVNNFTPLYPRMKT